MQGADNGISQALLHGWEGTTISTGFFLIIVQWNQSWRSELKSTQNSD